MDLDNLYAEEHSTRTPMPDAVAVRPRRGWGLALPHLGYGRCWRCSRPWWAAREHVVDYKPGAGQFALCQHCWDRSTVKQRIAAHFWVTAAVQKSTCGWLDILAAIKQESADDPTGEEVI